MLTRVVPVLEHAAIDKATTPRSAICRNVNELIRVLRLVRVN
jgi:hypothetical protein